MDYRQSDIIKYIKTLRDGDVVRPVISRHDFTAGYGYLIRKDNDGDLYVSDDTDCRIFVNIGGECDSDFLSLIEDGVFVVPNTPPFFLQIDNMSHEDAGDGSPIFYVTITADKAGMEKLEELDKESSTSIELARLLAKKAEIDAQIKKLQEAK